MDAKVAPPTSIVDYIAAQSGAVQPVLHRIRAIVREEAPHAEPTIAQGIVRAKHTLSEARVPFELPPREQWGLRLARMLSALAPNSPATHANASCCSSAHHTLPEGGMS